MYLLGSFDAARMCLGFEGSGGINQEELARWVQIEGGKAQEAANKILQAYQNHASSLDLKGLGLKTLPNEIGRLSSLEMLDLNDNKIEQLPAEIGNLSGLKVLYLYGNQLEDLPPTFSKLSQLFYLTLSKNKFMYVPNPLEGLNKLRYLFLDENQLTGLPLMLFYALPLERLSINRNRFELPYSIMKNSFFYENNGLGLDRSYTKVDRLSLSYSMSSWCVKEAGQGGLAEEAEQRIIEAILNRSSSLDLRHLKLHTLPDEIGLLTNLEELYLDHNSLEELPRAIGSLRNLRCLNLECNSLSDLPLEMDNISTLEFLGLGGNAFSAPPLVLCNGEALRGLDLSFNPIQVYPDRIPGTQLRIDLNNNGGWTGVYSVQA